MWKGGIGSVLERGGQGLVELEVVLGLREDGIEDRRLVEEEITLGWAARRREGWGPVEQIEVEEDGGDDGRVSEEREDAHGAAACGAQQWQDLVDTSEEDGPTDTCGAGGSGRWVGQCGA